MTKNILIPIDFSIASLNTLKLSLEQEHTTSLKVILLYAESPSSSITELLFYSREEIIENRMTPEFEEALEVIKNRFEKILEDIIILPFHGSNLNAMEAFLAGSKIEEIFIPSSYKLQTPGRAFDPVPLLKKASIPVHEVSWSSQHTFSGKNQLQSLLNWGKQ